MSKRGRSEGKLTLTGIIIYDEKSGGIAMKYQDRYPWGKEPEIREEYIQSQLKQKNDPEKVHAVIMGKTEFEKRESMPLPGMFTGVISTTLSMVSFPENPNIMIKDTLEEMIDYLNEEKEGLIDKVFVIGGCELFVSTYKQYDYLHILNHMPLVRGQPQNVDYDHALYFYDDFEINSEEQLDDRTKLQIFSKTVHNW